MVNMRQYRMDAEDWERRVMYKYGWDTLERAINRAQTEFWVGIHNKFLGALPDNADVDIDDVLVKAVLKYIYQNDEQLQD